MEKRTAGREAHLNALMAWNNKYSVEQAEEIIDKTPYAELNGTTGAETSIETAIKGIREKLLGEKAEISPDSAYKGEKPSEDPATYDKIIEILADIHDNWVIKYAGKYDRGDQETSLKKLYQHTPTALIGLDEVSLDLMFLAPFLKELGLDAGEMNLVPYGTFKPSRQVAEAYQRYVEKYLEKNGIYSSEDLEDHIKKCINGGYSPLAPSSEVAQKRVEYMKKNISKLVESIKSKNPESIGKLPSQSTLG